MTEKNFAMLCHLSALAGFIIPLGNIIGPLVVYLLKKDEMPEVEREGKESLNFQITLTIIAFAAFFILGFRLALLIPLVNLVFVILASVETSNGRPYKYPFKFELIK
ncbi:DUF4870 domain-containing protein [Alkaliflexus imshenetskii]|uniref:DUF4870 domain-containing protein n=1 Tax=Alkaliflexus imshenetskii TaxID=286730 RepID=UPI00047D4418|nr:DUF4870 domain-containing protein [Alkaliflexus imshenetskii]